MVNIQPGTHCVRNLLRNLRVIPEDLALIPFPIDVEEYPDDSEELDVEDNLGPEEEALQDFAWTLQMAQELALQGQKKSK